MADRPIKLPAIPAIMKTISPEVRKVLEPVREILTSFTSSENPIARVSHLQQAGLIKDFVDGKIIPAVETDFSIPPAPTGLVAGGAFANIVLSWDATTYKNLAHTEIWRAQTNDFASAQLIGTAEAQIYVDNVGGAATRYYWIRYVSRSNVTGPFNAQAGVEGSTGTDPGYLLDLLTDQISASQLSANLNQTIGDNTTAVEHLGTYYGIKTQVTQDERTVIGGIGIMGKNDAEAGPTIDIGFIANKIWFGAPSGTIGVPSTQPFVIQTTDETVNGVTVPRGVYMDAAYIKNVSAMVARLGNAWIDNAMIANLSASKITAGDVSAARMSANIVSALVGKFNSLSALTANLGTVTIDSSGYLITNGVTSYGSGIGVWLGYSGGAYKFRVGDPSGQCLKWDGANLTINGGGTFSGALSAASGSFAGALIAASGTFSGTLTASAINAVNTINIAGEAVTIPRALQSSNISIPISSNDVNGAYSLQTRILEMPVILSAGVGNPVSYVTASVGWNGTSHDDSFTSIALTMVDPSGVEWLLTGNHMNGTICLSNREISTTLNVYPGTWYFRIYASATSGILAARPTLFALTCAR